MRILKYQIQLLPHKNRDSYHLHTSPSWEILNLVVADFIKNNTNIIFVTAKFSHISTHIISRSKRGTGRSKPRQTLQ